MALVIKPDRFIDQWRAQLADDAQPQFAELLVVAIFREDADPVDGAEHVRAFLKDLRPGASARNGGCRGR